MILRSVIRHVRDQNGFAVGLDFVIVVIGAFIGIQVANWNEDRAEADLDDIEVGDRSSERRLAALLPDALGAESACRAFENGSL